MGTGHPVPTPTCDKSNWRQTSGAGMSIIWRLNIVKIGRSSILKVFFGGLVAVAAVVLGACGSSTATSTTTKPVTTSPATTTVAATTTKPAPTTTTPATTTAAPTTTKPAAGPPVTISLAAQNLAFDKTTITVPAGAAVTINFKNNDSVPHNFSLFTDAGANPPALFQGQIVSGSGSATYTFTAPTTPGTYFFRCDVHPTIMTGSFVVTQ